jgi:hypothetical protein
VTALLRRARPVLAWLGASGVALICGLAATDGVALARTKAFRDAFDADMFLNYAMSVWCAGLIFCAPLSVIGVWAIRALRAPRPAGDVVAGLAILFGGAFAFFMVVLTENRLRDPGGEATLASDIAQASGMTWRSGVLLAVAGAAGSLAYWRLSGRPRAPYVGSNARAGLEQRGAPS